MYYVGASYEPVDVRPIDEKTAKHYSLEQYSKIFKGYKEGDSIGVNTLGHIALFTLYRPDDSDPKVEIPAGFYRAGESKYGMALFESPAHKMDRHVDLRNNVDEMVRDVERFFANDQLYDQLDLQYKRGCLLYGAPGNGKTYQIMHAAKKVITSHDCIVIVIGPKDVWSMRSLDELRISLQDRDVIVILEEMTEWAKRGGMEDMLSFLDGEYSWDRCYIVTTTNYPEQLEANIIDRPGRFDLILHVDDPDARDRRVYLSTFLGGDVHPELITATEGFSIAYLKELITRSRLKDQSIMETIEELSEIRKIVQEFVANTEDNDE
jgi:SpoVK/Ycf46/Vps4 family AAA+-type ATPase